MMLALQGVPLVIVSIIAFILILGIIILIHEGGHFFFARRAGILCHEFSIGMGPAIYKKKFKETTFCIRAIPIGGYVSMAGEEVTSDFVKEGSEIGVNLLDGKISEIILEGDSEALIKGTVVAADLYGQDGTPLYITINDGFQDHYYEVMEDAFYVLKKSKMQITPYHRSFESKSLWQRFLTLVAGPCMNLILAIFLYLIVSFANGVPNYDSSEVGSISDTTNAVEVLEKGDVITKVNGVSINSWKDLSIELDKLVSNAQTNVVLEVVRDGQNIELDSIECTTYIVSLGLSNIEAQTVEFPEGIKNGVVAGKLALRYLDSGNKGTHPITSGDILTKIRVDHYVNGSPVTGEVVNITSWSQLVGIFSNTDVANVYFEYYSMSANQLISIENCAALQTYGNEVLNNQRIDKIQIKIGISPTNHFDFFGAIGAAFEDFWNDFTLIFRTLGLLIAPSGVRQVGVGDLSSFVGIFSLVEMFVGAGLLSLMAFTAMLSVNIGVLNLLPIPALDGGRIVFLGYELVTKKKPSKKVENLINNVFFILLMVLFVYVTFNDILRLIRG